VSTSTRSSDVPAVSAVFIVRAISACTRPVPGISRMVVAANEQPAEVEAQIQTVARRLQVDEQDLRDGGSDGPGRGCRRSAGHEY